MLSQTIVIGCFACISFLKTCHLLHFCKACCGSLIYAHAFLTCKCWKQRHTKLTMIIVWVQYKPHSLQTIYRMYAVKLIVRECYNYAIITGTILLVAPCFIYYDQVQGNHHEYSQCTWPLEVCIKSIQILEYSPTKQNKGCESGCSREINQMWFFIVHPNL